MHASPAINSPSNLPAGRLAWRIFGTLYAQPHPISADTTVLRNSAGLALPVEFTGEPVGTGLISPEEQAARDARLKKVCSSCGR